MFSGSELNHYFANLIGGILATLLAIGVVIAAISFGLGSCVEKKKIEDTTEQRNIASCTGRGGLWGRRYARDEPMCWSPDFQSVIPY